MKATPSAVGRGSDDWSLNQVETFIAACCACRPSFSQPASELYKGYERWASGLFCQVMSAAEFGLVLGELNFHRRKSSVRHWIGIRYSVRRAAALTRRRRPALSRRRDDAFNPPITSRDLACAVKTASAGARTQLVEAFMATCCKRDATARVSSADLFAAFNAWATSRGHSPMTKHAFGSVLCAARILRRKSSRMFWLGLRLVDDPGLREGQPSHTGGLREGLHFA